MFINQRGYTEQGMAHITTYPLLHQTQKLLPTTDPAFRTLLLDAVGFNTRTHTHAHTQTHTHTHMHTHTHTHTHTHAHTHTHTPNMYTP